MKQQNEPAKAERITNAKEERIGAGWIIKIPKTKQVDQFLKTEKGKRLN